MRKKRMHRIREMSRGTLLRRNLRRQRRWISPLYHAHLGSTLSKSKKYYKDKGLVILFMLGKPTISLMHLG
jgi:hypothetical protein